MIHDDNDDDEWWLAKIKSTSWTSHMVRFFTFSSNSSKLKKLIPKTKKVWSNINQWMMMIHPSIYTFPSTPTTSSPRSRGHKPLINLHPPISIQRFTLNPCSTRPLSSLCIYYTNQKLLHRKLRSAFFIFHFSIFIFLSETLNLNEEKNRTQQHTPSTIPSVVFWKKNQLQFPVSVATVCGRRCCRRRR